MSSVLPSQATRVFGVVVAVSGAASIVAARPLSRRLASTVSARPDPRIVLMLGVRQVAQGALVAAAPDPVIARIGAATDLLHAATMVAAALVWPAYRRPAAVSGALAVASAAAGLRVAARQTNDPR